MAGKTKAQIEQEEADRIAAETGEPTSTDVEAAKKGNQTRARAALTMAVGGATDDQIAQLLHYSTPEAARLAWERALGGRESKESDLISKRRLSNARYEAVLRSIAPLALNATIEVDDPKNEGHKKRVKNDDHVAYAKLFLSTVDRINVLNGLNAPTLSVVYTPDAAEFNQVVERMSRAVASAEEEVTEDELEGDIFEEGDDGEYGRVE